MIDFSKLHFKEKSCIDYIDHVQIQGALILTAEARLEKHSGEDVKKLVIERLQREIHHKVYGELYRPIMELADHALRGCAYDSQERIEKLRTELIDLLAFHKKSPGTSPLNGCLKPSNI